MPIDVEYSIVQDYFIILSRYSFISRSTSIRRYRVKFNISLRWRHGYTAIDRDQSIVMQPDAYWPKLNSCLYTGTKAGRSQSYQAGPYETMVAIICHKSSLRRPLLDAGFSMDINARPRRRERHNARNHRASKRDFAIAKRRGFVVRIVKSRRLYRSA